MQPNAALYSRRDAANGLVIGLDNGVPFVEVTNAGTVQRSGAGAPIAANGWHHLAVVAEQRPDHALSRRRDPYASLSAALPALNTIALIGGDTRRSCRPRRRSRAGSPPPDGAAAPAPDAAAPTPAPDAAAPAPAAAMAGFAGDIDELQIAKVARPAGFIKLSAIGQGPDQAKLISFSVDEETASWLSGYFAVILKSVTLDGWVVIGILMIMAAVSWVVMFDRVSYLNRQAKANARFMKSFREIAADLTMLDSGDADEISTPWRPPRRGRRQDDAGVVALPHLSPRRLGDPPSLRDRTASAFRCSRPRRIAAIRATLDSGYVKETQRLNRLMVVLTIAISGGPFLGLLGTVVGVMITFAAIAASGDVNVNAIAPGIAAALVATVAGLGRRDPGAVWLQLPDLPHQGSDHRHAGLRR